MTQRAVYDCNVYVQALISSGGPAYDCVRAALEARVAVYASNYILDEVQDVASRAKLIRRFRLTEERVDAFLQKVAAAIHLTHDVLQVFTFPRDPKDEHYIDLAIAADAQLVVSRDKDLLSLADPSNPDGRDFMSRFPEIRVVTPVDLLARLPAP